MDKNNKVEQEQRMQDGGTQVNKAGIKMAGCMKIDSIKQKYDIIIGQTKLTIVNIKNSAESKNRKTRIIPPITIAIKG